MKQLTSKELQTVSGARFDGISGARDFPLSIGYPPKLIIKIPYYPDFNRFLPIPKYPLPNWGVDYGPIDPDFSSPVEIIRC